MRCDQVEKLLIEFSDGELNAGEHAAVTEHLESCEECALELAALERMKLLLEDDGYVEPTSFFWTRFNARLRERINGGWLGGDDRWARLVPRLAPVVVAVAFFAIGMWVGVGALNAPSTGGQGPSLAPEGSFAEAPAVSPRSKLLVETGGSQPSFVTAADTLAPDAFDPFGDGSGMVLTGAEGQGRPTRYLGERLMGD